MKQTIRLTEGDLHRIIKRCVNETLGKTYDYDGYVSRNSNLDSLDLDDTNMTAITRKDFPSKPIDNYRRRGRLYKITDL